MEIAQTTLIDRMDAKRQVSLTIYSKDGQLHIKASGYGDNCSQDGEGYPIVIEVFDNELTHIISLEGAKEDKRIDEEDATEQQRRDEKHGLYPEREDIAN